MAVYASLQQSHDEAISARASPKAALISCLSSLTKRPKRGSHLVGKQRWLLPGGKVSAYGKPVVVDQLRIGLFCPAARRFVELVRKDADAHRDFDALHVEEPELVLPVEASRRNRCIRQPVKGDVVENVVARKAAGVSGKGTRDELVTLRVVVEHPGREADGRIGDSVERLRALVHLDGVGDMVGKEVVQLLVRAPLLGG